MYLWPKFPSEIASGGVWKQIYQVIVKGLSRTGLKTFFAFCFSVAFLARWVLVAETVRASAIWVVAGFNVSLGGVVFFDPNLNRG